MSNILEAQPSRLMQWIRHHIIASIVAFISLCALVYWNILASDIYVAEAHVMVQKTDLPGQVGEVGGLLSGMLGTNGNSDQLILKDFLQSRSLLERLDHRLQLRAHYSDNSHDFLSRLWRTEKEWFHAYFLQHVEIYLDSQDNILKISVQAYDPVVAKDIAQAMLEEGELFMNQTAHSLAVEQVGFLERQVATLKQNVMKSRQQLLDYQNQHGLISPQTSAESLSVTISQLEVKKIEMEAQISAMRAYLVADHPNIVMLQQQVVALNQQIEKERSKLVANDGKRLNAKVEAYQRLEFEAGFAEEVYKTAISALERGRIEAARTLKKLLVLQMPDVPEYPEKPRRLYNSLVSLLLLGLCFGIAQLILAIIREHKD